MRLFEALGRYLVYLGIPGLFVIALLDSAAIPMVGGPDAIVLLLSWHNPSQLLVIAAVAASGSTLGCLVLYRIAKAGGSLVLARLSAEKREKAVRMIEGNAAWAVFTSVVVPPPFPTKAVILAAGAFRAPVASFTVAILAGRLIRYTLMAWVGARFGDQAARVIREHYLSILVVVLATVLVILAVRRIRDKKKPHG